MVDLSNRGEYSFERTDDAAWRSSVLSGFCKYLASDLSDVFTCRPGIVLRMSATAAVEF